MDKIFIQMFFELVIHLSGIGSIADFADYHQSQSESAIQRMGAIEFQRDIVGLVLTLGDRM